MFHVALLLCLANVALAQSGSPETVTAEANAANQEIEMADKLRADGKIYVVVGCVLVVLAGMIFYLVAIDRKVGRLEKQYNN